ncbi:MAG: hypothetical protein RLZZ502_1369 [Pseudomonadota bacterium]|jgi:predicted TIM-barrel fold metal-dependent hydrolase
MSLLLQNACDTHVHVFDKQHFPLTTPRAYTPPDASVDELTDMLVKQGMSRVVLIQPSVYGTDNRCLLTAMTALSAAGQVTARGVAVVETRHCSEADILSLHAAGVRGLRINIKVNGQYQAEDYFAISRACKHLGWHLQVYTSMDMHMQLLDIYKQLDMPVVLDHFAGGTDDAVQLTQLFDCMRQYPIYVKLSAAYRLAPGFSAAELSQGFYAAAPTQVLWGTDWPHTGGGKRGDNKEPHHSEQIEPFRVVDNQQALDTVLQALGVENSMEAAQKLLVDNPAQLYDF